MLVDRAIIVSNEELGDLSFDALGVAKVLKAVVEEEVWLYVWWTTINRWKLRGCTSNAG